MRIISTIKVLGLNLVLCVFFSTYLAGCEQKNSLQQAQEYARQSKIYYEQAIAKYEALLGQGGDLDKLYLEMGSLYYQHGEFDRAIKALEKSADPQAKKLLALSHYWKADFTDALELFSSQEPVDDEYLYYQALTCEKLNLFDQALGLYNKIKEKKFASFAAERMNIIEKQSGLGHIRDLNPALDKILSSSPSQEQYPQAGALILVCDEKIEVTPDWKEVSTLRYVIKILNERGKEDFSEVAIDYDSTYEKVELEYARTIKPDGQAVEVGSRHIRDVSKYLNFPLYSNARVYIISFPEIAEGSSIEYKLKIYRNQLINKKDSVFSYTVQASEPIIDASFSISLPKEKALRAKILNDKYNNFGAELKPKIKEENGLLIYSWIFKDIPQIIPEPDMPPGSEINPTILLSTFDSWDEVYKWWWGMAKDKIVADKAIQDAVKELTEGLDSEEAKIRAIYNFCAQKIRYVAVEYGQAGYEPHRATDVFKNKYGDCKDQAILLVTMLKEVGITAWPVLIATKDAYNLNTDLPAMLFNHCIACVSLKNEIIFLDPTAETCAFGDLRADDQGRRVLIIQEDGYKIHDIPFYPAEHNLNRQYIKLKVNGDETIAVEKKVFTYGVYDQSQRYWLLYTPPELIEAALKERVQGISIGGTLDKYSIENMDDLNKPIVLSYAFKGPEYFTAAGNLRMMPQLAGSDTTLVAKDKRKYPIDFGIFDSDETAIEIEIPENFAIKYLPDSVIEDNPWFKLAVGYKQKDNKIVFSQKNETKNNTVLESEYADFKKMYEALAKRVKQRIVLERKK